MIDEPQSHPSVCGFFLLIETARLLAQAVEEGRQFRGTVGVTKTPDGQRTGGFTIHIEIDPPKES